MPATALLPAAPQTSSSSTDSSAKTRKSLRSLSSAEWRDHFRAKQQAPFPLPWTDPYRLTAAEKESIASSIQQFQLGESAEGRRLLKRGATWATERRDPDFPDSLLAFIREEQRHSAWLAGFMDLNGIPCLRAHWIDGAFRQIRVLAGLELSVSVLVTAEVIAVPFYRALGRATRSPLLRALCDQILIDEDEHLEYQGRTLGLIRGRRSLRGSFKWAAHRLFQEATNVMVWFEYNSVFRAAGYSFAQLRHEALGAFERLKRAASHAAAPGSKPKIAFGRPFDE